ncbi:MAG TPA: LacI family DNA-binding transcriptional regulator, partial [Syntrophales bacterium]|nr:LacI family DNA-binding transcriptional regulator [Syntrophales bacterium]
MYRKTGLVKDNRFLLHGNDWTHPESPARLKAVYKMLEAPDMQGRFFEIPPRDVSQEILERVHRRSYIERIARTKERIMVPLDPDTDATEETYDVARLAGVSRGTVSFVVNGLADGKVAISPETRARVWQAVEELGYVPDAGAQA